MNNDTASKTVVVQIPEVSERNLERFLWESKRLENLLTSGYEIVRTDTTRNAITYILTKDEYEKQKTN